MTSKIPDLAWAAEIASRKGITTRCPFATVHRCPKYFDSLSILADAGIARMQKSQIKELLDTWTEHELWPASEEDLASASGGSPVNCFSAFCPEVSFDYFKAFASHVVKFYADLERDLRAKRLQSLGVPEDRWEWHFDHLSPMHYSDCAMYARLLGPQRGVVPSPAVRKSDDQHQALRSEAPRRKSTRMNVGTVDRRRP